MVKRSKQLKMGVKCGYGTQIHLKMPGVEKIKGKNVYKMHDVVRIINYFLKIIQNLSAYIFLLK